jgi:hypothetical protein
MTPLQRRLWLCIPPLAACGADVVATLVGQGRRYWSGGYAHVTEWNPVARQLLRLHPLTFVAAASLACAFVVTGVVLLNRRLAVVLAFAVTFCHAAAAASWAARAGPAGVAVAVAMLVGAERLVALSWRRANPTI